MGQLTKLQDMNEKGLNSE